MTSIAQASSTGVPASSSRQQICPICSTNLSKYTCPGCDAKTCSLDCTKQHKAKTGCTGQRDRTEYVGMDKYGDISMWRDLGYLREVGQRLKDWGVGLQPDIQKHQLQQERRNAAFKNRKGKESTQRGHGSHNFMQLPPKELKLKLELGRRDIEMLYLPAQMEKHKQNQSGFSGRKRKLYLSVSLCLMNDKGGRVSITTTHNHEITSPLFAALKTCGLPEDCSHYSLVLPVPIRPAVFASKNDISIPTPASEEKKSKLEEEKPLPMPHASLPQKPTWVSAPVESADPLPEEPPLEPVKPKIDFGNISRRVWEVPYDEIVSLEKALKGTAILEWPEFELWPTTALNRQLKEEKLLFMERRIHEDRQRKRINEINDGKETSATGQMSAAPVQQKESDSSSDDSSSLSSDSDSDED